MLAEYNSEIEKLIYLALRLGNKPEKPECRGKKIRSLYGAVKFLEQCGTHEDIEIYKEYLILLIKINLTKIYGYPTCFPEDELRKRSLRWVACLYEQILGAIKRGDFSTIEKFFELYEKLNEYKRPECRYLDEIY
jgi:hypothetical protein